MKSLAILLVITLQIGSSSADLQGQNVGTSASTADIPRDELVMVRSEPGASVTAGAVLSALDRAVAVPALDIPDLGISVYRTPGRAAVIPQAVERLDGVAWAARPAEWDLPAEPWRSVSEPMALTALGPPDREPLWSLQWPLAQSAVGDIRSAWEVATGLGVLVGVIDTGIDCSHVDIRCTHQVNHYDGIRRVEMYELSSRTDVVHGTHTSGIIAGAHNGRGTIGIAPDAEILGCKACSDGGRCSELDVTACLAYLAPRGVKVINLSLGGSYGLYTPAMCEATAWASQAHGVLVVASVGNSGPSQAPLYPASCGGVMGVAASVPPLGSTLADYSQRASVDITAPGTQVAAPVPGDRWAYLSGTSMAAPHVAGAAALLAEAMGDTWSPGEAARLLTEYARRICGATYQGRLCGWGALDIASSVRAHMPAQPTPSGDDPTATPWWGTDEPETPTVEPTPTAPPTATHLPAVQTALAELTETARPPTEAPTATEAASPTRVLVATPTPTTPPPPTASRTATVSPTPSDTPDAVALTVTAMWPTATPDIAGTLTAIAPTPDRVATAVWATLNAPGAVETRAAQATERAKGRHGPQYFPALLRVLPEPVAGPTDPCRDVLYPWACPQRTRDAMATREVEGTVTAVAAATMTAQASPPFPTRSWPDIRIEAR